MQRGSTDSRRGPDFRDLGRRKADDRAGARRNGNVKALVYVAAFAPEATEPVGPLTKKYPSSIGKALNPDLERFYAKRMNATTSEINSSHVPFISHPQVVARLIEQAATATAKRRW
jgi:hypothetical protein